MFSIHRRPSSSACLVQRPYFSSEIEDERLAPSMKQSLDAALDYLRGRHESFQKTKWAPFTDIGDMRKQLNEHLRTQNRLQLGDTSLIALLQQHPPLIKLIPRHAPVYSPFGAAPLLHRRRTLRAAARLPGPPRTPA
ncbi:MAG: hypothetical protein MO853_11695 [Candidatus Protistobacter heckmanni]|nr:hypothetical protein [Candidatus Protistobacter heckmanni]